MTCPMYVVDQKTLRSREMSATRQRQPDQTLPLPWCKHPQSPATQRLVHSLMGGALLLQCGGAVSKCQVPGEPMATT